MDEVEKFINGQRALGQTDDQIRQQLLANGWQLSQLSSFFVPKPPTSTPTPTQSAPVTQSEPTKAHLSASQVLLVIGVLLIIIAAVVILSISWENLTPLTKIAVLAVPELALFGTYYYVRRQETLGHVVQGTLLAAFLLLPVSIGAFIYQSNLYHDLNSLLFAVSSVIALPVYFFFDYKKQPIAVLFSIIGTIASLIFFGAFFELGAPFWSVGALIIGIATFMIAKLSYLKKDDYRFPAYQVISALVLLASIPWVTYDLLNQFLPELMKEVSSSVEVPISISIGVILLSLGSLYGKLFQPSSRQTVELQRLIQFVSLGFLLLPVIGAITENNAYVVAALALSVGLILLGLLVGINLIFVGGVIGGVMSLLIWLFKEVSSILTPISLIILGFIAIGLSIFLGRLKLSHSLFRNATLGERYGFISDEQALTVSQPKRKGLGCLIALLIILLLLLIPALIGIAGSLHGANNPFSVNNTQVYYDVRLSIGNDRLTDISTVSQTVQPPGSQLATKQLTVDLTIDSPDKLTYGIGCSVYEPKGQLWRSVGGDSVLMATGDQKLINQDRITLSKGVQIVQVNLPVKWVTEQPNVATTRYLSNYTNNGPYTVYCLINSISKNSADSYGGAYSTIQPLWLRTNTDGDFLIEPQPTVTSIQGKAVYDLSKTFTTQSYQLSQFIH